MESGQGVQLRAIDGRRSSQLIGKTVFGEAAGSVDASLAASIEREKEWRKNYLGPIRRLVEAGTKSGKDALRIASEGLASVHQNVVFRIGDDDLPLVEAVEAGTPDGFRTGSINGTGPRQDKVVIPYRGQALEGDRLLGKLHEWVEAALIERSCAEAVENVIENPEWLDLSDLNFALLGAAAEMGPLESLARWGATIVAVDLPRPALWERVLDLARNGSGRMVFPQTGDRPGADLLTQAPDICAWLSSLGVPLVVGSYAYADGSSFLRVSAALDAITVVLNRSRSEVAFAYLATPTDVFAVPAGVVERSRNRRTGGMSRVARTLTRGRMFAPNYPELVAGEDGRQWGIADSLVQQQGPNYALAKMLQRWRAISASEEGTLTSANVAPATRTRSVVKNRILATAYRGASAFGIEVFEPETSRALMATLLVHDLRNPRAPGNPDTVLDHPYDLFAHGAAHGGLWTNAYSPRSVLPLAVVVGATRRRQHSSAGA